jgi:hypothetical protein
VFTTRYGLSLKYDSVYSLKGWRGRRYCKLRIKYVYFINDDVMVKIDISLCTQRKESHFNYRSFLSVSLALSLHTHARTHTHTPRFLKTGKVVYNAEAHVSLRIFQSFYKFCCSSSIQHSSLPLFWTCVWITYSWRSFKLIQLTAWCKYGDNCNVWRVCGAKLTQCNIITVYMVKNFWICETSVCLSVIYQRTYVFL